MKFNVGFISSLLFVLLATSTVFAKNSVDEILEQARSGAQEIEKLKKVLTTEPDQNVRLKVFELMLNNQDSTMREVAVETGLASADKLLQSAAFKEAIMRLDAFHLQLKVDPKTSNQKQKLAKEYIETFGHEYVIRIKERDKLSGTFSHNYFKGQVTGTHLSFLDSHVKVKGTLGLLDDNKAEGKISMPYKGEDRKLRSKNYYIDFIATIKIR